MSGPDAFWRVWLSRWRLRRAARRYFIDTRPIPPADLERAKRFVRESGWVTAKPANSQPGSGA